MTSGWGIVVLVTCSAAVVLGASLPGDCHTFCAFGLTVHGCYCSKDFSVNYLDMDPGFDKLPLTTLKPSATTDICDYLCYIQLGGDACQCSKPGVPGRR